MRSQNVKGKNFMKTYISNFLSIHILSNVGWPVYMVCLLPQLLCHYANYPKLVLCTNEFWVRFLDPAPMCIWFSVQAFIGFSWLWFSLLHVKLGFLDRSVSGVSWKHLLNLIGLHYWVLPGFPRNVIDKIKNLNTPNLTPMQG